MCLTDSFSTDPGSEAVGTGLGRDFVRPTPGICHMACGWVEDSRVTVSYSTSPSCAIQLQLFRQVLKSDVRASRRVKTEEQELAISKKRQTLEFRIQKHQDEAEKYFSAATIDSLLGNPTPLSEEDSQHDSPWESDEEHDSDSSPDFTFSSLLPTTIEHLPEERQILLPSTLGHQKCVALGYQKLARMELTIREGQANDALQAIRMAIGEKSFIFRKQLRNANSKSQKTRSWDSIHTVSKKLSHHRVIYSNACCAMIALNASPELLEKYKVLKKDDIQTNTAIQEPNAMGQRNSALPWIWMIPGSSSQGPTTMLKECEW
jgi:hypothetical protein